MVVSRAAPASGTSLSLLGVLWRGAVVGVVVGAAQFAFSLPGAQYSGLDTHRRLPLVMLAVLVGVPVSGLVFGVVAARRMRLRRPVLVAVVGLVLSIGLAMVTLWLGVPHLTAVADPGVWCFGAACAVPGYAAAALILVPPWRVSGPLRSVSVLAAAVAVVVAGSWGWLEVAYLLRAQTLRDTGVPLVVADIPGYQLREVAVHDGAAYRGAVPSTELSYLRSSDLTVRRSDARDVIDMYVYRDSGRPHDCAEARAYLGHHGTTTYTCRDMGERWVLDPSDSRSHVVIAIHNDAVVVLGGATPEVVQATLRTASARELATVHPGRS